MQCIHCELLLGHVVPLSVVMLSLWAGSSGLDLAVASVRGRGGGVAFPVVPVRRSGAAPLMAP